MPSFRPQAADRGVGYSVDDTSFMMYRLVMKARELMQRFEQAGWKLVRVCGSHHLYGKKGITFFVPFHGSKDLKIGLVRAALKKIEEVE